MHDKAGIESRTYFLRWRFDYIDRREPKTSPWERSSHIESEMAYRQNREGLIRAAIEAKELRSKDIRILAECDGHDFINFQWMAVSFCPVEFTGEHELRNMTIGLKLVTRDYEYQVYINGDVVKSIRTEAEKGIHFATFGR